ncbi:MAG: 4Fe-4S dicluster domain-containing protein [Candidatus Omnitrophota bacterium]|nr:4Fe-4S dicluster domain-containing protein [Candidatus Omnitrophota bacterium]
MNKSTYFIERNNFIILLNNLSREYCVIAPYGDKGYFWQNFTQSFEYNSYRPITSIRQFFTSSTEYINGYFTSQAKTKKFFCIVGAKSCDLTSLQIQDFVFLEGETDASYKNMRDNNLIISSDCTSFKEVCFCLALEIKPYPEKLFDLNISALHDGYLVEVGSAKGLETIERNQNLFTDVSDKYLAERKQKRENIVEKLLEQLKPQNLPKRNTLYNLIKNGYTNQFWTQEAARCVECGACIMNCPTCHCFLLFDTKSENGYLRGRIWDGCQYKNFTRVAGGANALKFREHRLRNRYIKKFEFFPDRINTYACTGCGRCIECCPGKIDLREIFKELSKDSSSNLELTA